jgi:hypothetical protein
MNKLTALACVMLTCAQGMCSSLTWTTPPDTISNVSLNATDPQLAMDSSGNVVGVWVENNVVKAKTKLVSGSWSSSVTLSNTNASWPCVVVDSSGNATAAWIESGVVKAASKPFGSSWSSASTLSTATAISLDLAIDSAGDVVALWARAGDIQSSTKMFGGAWQTKVTISSTSATLARVALGGSGSNTRAVAVWNGLSGSTPVVYSSTKLISGSWSAQQTISTTTSNAGFADVAVDNNGNATAVWYKYDVAGTLYSGVVANTASRPAAGSWGSVTKLCPAGLRNPADLKARVAYDSNGNAVAVWSTSFNGESFDILSAVKPALKEWEASKQMVNSLYTFQPDLAVCQMGDAVAVNMFYNGSVLQIQSSEADITSFGDNSWSVPINVSLDTGSGFPRIAAMRSGNTIYTAALWLQSNGSLNLVQAATGSRSIVAPPTSLSVSQTTNNQGVFSTYKNTVSWTASVSSDVVGYLVYRNGVFFQQLPSSATQFVDDNRKQNEAVVYGVAAVDSQQSHSAIATVTFP